MNYEVDMPGTYDIDVDYEELCEIERKLNAIYQNLKNGRNLMSSNIQKCEGFLSGNQFNIAKEKTKICTDLTSKTANNIATIIAYISELKECVLEYNESRYTS